MKTKIIITERTKRSIITTALIVAAAIIIALFTSCSTPKQTLTASALHSTHSATVDSLALSSLSQSTAAAATVLGSFASEQTTTTTQTTATDEETTTETITETTSPDGTQERVTKRTTTRRSINTQSDAQNAATTKNTILSAYQYADSLVANAKSSKHTTTSDTLTASQSTQKTPTSTFHFPSSFKIIIIIIIAVLIAELAERIYNKNKTKEQ